MWTMLGQPGERGGRRQAWLKAPLSGANTQACSHLALVYLSVRGDQSGQPVVTEAVAGFRERTVERGLEGSEPEGMGLPVHPAGTLIRLPVAPATGLSQSHASQERLPQAPLVPRAQPEGPPLLTLPWGRGSPRPQGALPTSLCREVSGAFACTVAQVAPAPCRGANSVPCYTTSFCFFPSPHHPTGLPVRESRGPPLCRHLWTSCSEPCP